MPPDVVQRLQLRRVDMPANTAIESPGDPIEKLHFLEAGAASMTTTFQDGSQVEIGLFGYESVLGVSALMGVRRSLNRVYMQLDGHGFTVAMNRARAEFLQPGIFQNLILRSVQAQLSQVSQSTGCNAKHDVQQRLARWLLLCADRARSRDLIVSQEFLATMLGVRRMSASVTVGHFKQAGFIDHHRGKIRILDPKGLEGVACECYRVVKSYLDSATEFETGFTAAEEPAGHEGRVLKNS
ncbi:MAG: Crp/Fnr family transcriptional regulator [Janthinobacterium lividum]